MSVHISTLYADCLCRVKTVPELSRQLRRADDFIRLGVQGGYAAIKDRREKDTLPAERFGLFLGTAFGTMETNFAVLNQAATKEPTSPILFSHSVFSAAAGYIATLFDIQGCALTLTDFFFPFFRALEQGYLAVLSGRLDHCLVLQVETYSALLLDAVKKHGSAAELWHPGVVCWLLGKEDPKSCFDYRIESLNIKSGSAKPHTFLQFREKLWVNERSFDCSDPLAAATLLTREMATAQNQSELNCRIVAQYGTVKLSFRSRDRVER